MWCPGGGTRPPAAGSPRAVLPVGAPAATCRDHRARSPGQVVRRGTSRESAIPAWARGHPTYRRLSRGTARLPVWGLHAPQRRRHRRETSRPHRRVPRHAEPMRAGAVPRVASSAAGACLLSCVRGGTCVSRGLGNVSEIIAAGGGCERVDFPRSARRCARASDRSTRREIATRAGLRRARDAAGPP